jgi:5,10-methylenetetrahydrofolate reductase
MPEPDLLTALGGGRAVIAAELRPPRAELALYEGLDAWIDTYHAVKRLTHSGTYVFLTDGAVGASEEDNLRHLVANLGRDVPRERIVPFLTAKHSLDYCFSYAERAQEHGFPAVVVLGGDKTVGVPRSVEHAWQLRQMIRARNRSLILGGWANPHADAAQQVEYLATDRFFGEFYLTQIVSHHQLPPVQRFIELACRRNIGAPGVFGIFFYRSASRRTLEALRQFLPVPIEGLTREFGEGLTAEEICARSVKALRDAGARHFYISNLPIGRAAATLTRILEHAGIE